jgi:signal peptidase I
MGKHSTAKEYVRSVGGAVFLALLLRSFVVEAYQIPSGSMIPTLQIGDRIFVNKFIYGVRLPFTHIRLGAIRAPHRGEVIVFAHPRDRSTDLIKRVVAVAGDTVELRDDVLYVNDLPVARQHLDGECRWQDYDERSDRWRERGCEAWQEQLGEASYTTQLLPSGGAASPRVRVPDGAVFVMGDNRDDSADSRVFGFVPVGLIAGRAAVVWWSSGGPEGVRFSRLGHLIH